MTVLVRVGDAIVEDQDWDTFDFIKHTLRRTVNAGPQVASSETPLEGRFLSEDKTSLICLVAFTGGFVIGDKFGASIPVFGSGRT